MKTLADKANKLKPALRDYWQLLRRLQFMKLASRILTRFLLADGDYFRRKLLLTPVIYGPKEGVRLGRQVNLQNTVLNTNSGTITIGDHTFFGHDCMVLTGTHDASMRDEARKNDHPRAGNDIRIGRGVWISSRAIILGGVSIADNSVIAAGAIVTKSCLEPAIYGGIPARRISDLPPVRP